MPLIRNIIMLFGGLAMLFFAFTAGIFIFAILAVIGLAFTIYFKLRKKDIINRMEQMGMGTEQDSPTIDAEYEVVDADYEIIEDDSKQKD